MEGTIGMRRSGRSTVIGLTALGAVLLAGCGAATPGNGSQAAKRQLISAVTRLGESSTLTGTLRVAGTAAELRSLSASRAGMSGRVASLLAGADLSFAEESISGHPLTPAECAASNPGRDANGVVSFNLRGNPILQTRVLGKSQTLYLQVNATPLLRLTGTPAAHLRQTEARLPKSLGFVRQLLAGRWLALSLRQLQSLQQGGGQASLNEADPCRLAQGLTRALQGRVTVTRPAANHYVVTTSLRSLATGVLSFLRSSEPAAAGPLGSVNSNRVPSTTVRLDAYVAAGRLSELVLGISQFVSPDQRAHVLGSPAVVISFGTAAPAVTAPTHSVPVTVQQLLPLLGLLGRTTHSFGSTSASAAVMQG